MSATTDIATPAAVPVFISQLARAIAGLPARLSVMPAAQWRSWLAANAAKLGVKREEIEWSGIEEFLDLRGSSKVAREDLIAYLERNGLRVAQVFQGSPAAAARNQTDEEGDWEGDWDATRRSEASKYRTYSLPGGENYRDLLIKLRSREVKGAAFEWTAESMQLKRETFIHDMGFGADDVDAAIARVAAEGSIENATRSLGRLRSSGFYPEGTIEQQVFLRGLITGARNKNARALAEVQKTTFRSTHWDERNVLAHIRMDDRVDAEGRRVLFINEIQSDWGQLAKRHGMKPTPAELRGMKPGSPAAVASLGMGDYGPMVVEVDDGFGP